MNIEVKLAMYNNYFNKRKTIKYLMLATYDYTLTYIHSYMNNKII